MKTLLSSLILSTVIASVGSATTILVDFGNAVTTSGTETWNNFMAADTAATSVPSGTSIPLLTSTGTASTYTLTLAGGSLEYGTGNTTSPIGNTYTQFSLSTVISDFVYTNVNRTFTISGLNPSITYDLTFYAYADRTGTRGTSFAIPGSTSLILEPSGTLDSGGQIGNISAVTPDASGNIVITASTTAGTNWILSGLAINYTIPEPSTALLALVGMVPLLRRRR